MKKKCTYIWLFVDRKFLKNMYANTNNWCFLVSGGMESSNITDKIYLIVRYFCIRIQTTLLKSGQSKPVNISQRIN